MHIPDAMLDPRVALVTGAFGAAGLLLGRKLERQLGERTTVLMGTMAAFVFAAQMVNFPVGLGVSGHLLGGVLASVLLGPWAGAVVIAAVLLVQCFLFADGGVTALGANFVNMGLVGAVLGYAIYAPIRRWIGGPKGVLIAAMVAAWFSVLLASGAFAVELAASGRGGFFQILSLMALVHAAIGLGEAIITGLVVRFLLVRRPDLFETPEGPDAAAISLAGAGAKRWRAAWRLRWRSPYSWLRLPPNRLTASSSSAKNWDSRRRLRQRHPSPPRSLTINYPGLHHVKMATAAAGLVGTLVVFGVAWGMARVLARSKGKEATPDAA